MVVDSLGCGSLWLGRRRRNNAGMQAMSTASTAATIYQRLHCLTIPTTAEAAGEKARVYEIKPFFRVSRQTACWSTSKASARQRAGRKGKVPGTVVRTTVPRANTTELAI